MDERIYLLFGIVVIFVFLSVSPRLGGYALLALVLVMLLRGYASGALSVSSGG